MSKLKKLSHIDMMVFLEILLDEEKDHKWSRKWGLDLKPISPYSQTKALSWDPEWSKLKQHPQLYPKEIRSDPEIIASKQKEKYIVEIDNKHIFKLDQIIQFGDILLK